MLKHRFYVQSVTRFAYPNGGWAEPKPVVSVKLNVVTGAKGEQNKTWASATPQGDITAAVAEPSAKREG